MKKRLHLDIRGRVQGVCYRMYAQEEAARLGVTGWIRNGHDGSVEAVAEGDEAKLKEFEKWCRRGPPAARVTDVEAAYSDVAGEFNTFSITY
jgi:acylphosphatase